jgi:serine/threonine protein kinase
MGVTIGVNTRLAANQAGFGQAMSKGVDKELAGKALRELDSYIRDAQGNLRQGDIRIVNTTNDKQLEFKFKSFGWGPQYRTERTADALVGLLTQAGVQGAQAKVDAVLKNKGNQAGYARLNAESLSTLLKDPAVRTKIYSETQHISRFMQDQGYQFAAQSKAGGQGTAHFAKFAGKDQVVKLFTTNGANLEPQSFKGERNKETKSEYFASYLGSSTNSEWKKPLVVAPSQYIVRKGEGFEALSTEQVRARVKAAKRGGDSVVCVGLVMDKAPGTEVKHLPSMKPGDAASKGLAKSGLQTLRALNERGFIHRDIKPENMSFDPVRKEAHFFDTGMMFKSHKPAAGLLDKGRDALIGWVNGVGAGEGNLPIKGLGTNGYVHSRVAQGEPCGSQADLHAFALTLLEKTYPGLKALTLAPNNRPDQDPDDPQYISGDEFLPRLQELSAANSRTTNDARTDAGRFLDDLKKPNSYAHFINKCLQAANAIKPGQWANRAFSNQKLDDLMNHPALQD